MSKLVVLIYMEFCSACTKMCSLRFSEAVLKIRDPWASTRSFEYTIITYLQMKCQIISVLPQQLIKMDENKILHPTVLGNQI